MNAHFGQDSSDLLSLATAALRDAVAPEKPSPDLVASTVEALRDLDARPQIVARDRGRLAVSRGRSSRRSDLRWGNLRSRAF